MDYIVVEVFNIEFVSLYVINCDNLLELRTYIKETLDTDINSYLIYDIDGTFIEVFA